MNWAKQSSKSLLFRWIMLGVLSFGLISCDKDNPIEKTVPSENTSDGNNASDNEQENKDNDLTENPSDENKPSDSDKPNESNDNSTDNPTIDENMNNRQITVTIGSTTFTATLEDNPTGKVFQAMLPMTITMDELGGNEKYHYLSSTLPNSPYSPGTIYEGDLMLYGSSCVVLFYQTFRSSYSYTRIGKIDNPQRLATAVGSGSVSITFENQESR